jgi:HEAT repeat protein
MARDANEQRALRTTALNGLVNVEGGAGVAVLMRLTEAESDAWLAGSATDALVRTSDARVRPQLRRLVERAQTPEASRVKMINALGNGDGTVRDAAFLRTTYPRFTERERIAALAAVGNIGDRSSIAWLLVRASDAGEPLTLRRSAVQRAARAGARTSELTALFDTVPERDLRLAVIDALAADGSRPAMDKLLAVARSTADVAVRRRAVTKLGESGDPRAKDLLQELVGR